MRPLVLFPLVALSLSLAMPCCADTLTPVTGYVQLFAPTNNVSYSAGSGTYFFSGVHASSVFGLDPSVSGSFTASFLPPILGVNPYNIPVGYDSESVIFYEFEVSGPAGQVVPINFASAGSASVSLSGVYNVDAINLNASAFLSVSDPVGVPLLTATACAGGPSLVSDPCANRSGPSSDSFNISQVLNVETGVPYLVNIYTSDSIQEQSYPISGSFSAASSVDPTITLATDDPAYSLQFSPGLISSTPEPSSLALFSTGIAGIAAFARGKFAARTAA
jgi:hypothetical protein